MKLSTIQKRENLNQVFSKDEVGPGGAHHNYLVMSNELNFKTQEPLVATEIQFQKGPRKEEGSTPGVIDMDLLEIVRDRLKSFQSGPFSSRENACALTHIEEALMWLNMRIENRIEKGILGKNAK